MQKPTTLIATVLLLLTLAACNSAVTPVAETTAAPAVEATVAPAVEATAAPVVEATDAPVAAETTTAPVVEPTNTPAAVVSATPTAADAVVQTDSSATATNTKLNLNTSTDQDYLSAIPGFSNRMVREFLEYRPYISIQQFRKEIGKYVDDQQVTEYENYVYVPVDINQSDAETLKQLPGVDDALAAALIAGRPYSSNDAFLAKLAETLSQADVTLAATYLAAN